jgi:hypothetical protein
LNKVATDLGYESVQEFVKQFTLALNNIDIGWKDIHIPGLDKTVQENIKLSTG